MRLAMDRVSSIAGATQTAHKNNGTASRLLEKSMRSSLCLRRTYALACGALLLWACADNPGMKCTTTADCPQGSRCEADLKICVSTNDAEDAGNYRDAGTSAADAGPIHVSIYHSPGMGTVSAGGLGSSSKFKLVHSVDQPGMSSTSASSNNSLHSGVAATIGSEP